MHPVVIAFLPQHRNGADHLSDKLTACGFRIQMHSLEQAWQPVAALAVIVVLPDAVPAQRRTSLPTDALSFDPLQPNYDHLIAQLVARLASQSSDSFGARDALPQEEIAPQAPRRREMQPPAVEQAEADEQVKRSPSRGMSIPGAPPKPAETAPPLARPLPAPAAPAPSAPPQPLKKEEAERSTPTARSETLYELTDQAAGEAAPAPEPAAESAEARFTAFIPRQAVVERWHSLIVYAHTAAMLEKIRSDAKRFEAELGAAPREVRDSQAAALARGTRITFTPQAEGVTFNPESITLGWWEDLHRVEFRFKADAALADQAANLSIAVSVDPIIVAVLRGGVLFEPPNTGRLPNQVENTPVTAEIFRAEEIFISYSRKDAAVAVACRNAYRALGYKVLMDMDELRSGEHWSVGLERMIERATIFQLFWSEHSANSQFCRQEWEYALRKAAERGSDGMGFIRPVYWDDPLVSPPKELGHLHFAYVRLPRLARRAE
jgi:chemotaxis protein histidine kinase CheA